MEVFSLVSTILAAICVALSIYQLLRKWVVYVPPNHVVVVLNTNNQATTRGQGYHLVKWPFECVSMNEWSYRSVDDRNTPKMVRYHSPYIPTQAITMDTPSYTVTDRDGVTVEVDVAFTFVISDPRLAVTQNKDLFAFLAGCVEGATSYVINKMNYQEAIGKCALIAHRMHEDLANQLQNSGCTIRTLLVQNVLLNKKLSKTAEQQSIDAQQAQIEQNKLTQQRIIAEQRLEQEERLALVGHENKVRALERQQWLARTQADHERDLAVAEKERELILAKQAVEIARQAEEARVLKQDTDARAVRVEHEQRLEYITALIKTGIPSTEVVNLVNGVEVAKQMARGLTNSTKMIASPEHFRQMFSLPWLPSPTQT